MSDLEGDREGDKVSDLVRDWVGEICMGDLCSAESWWRLAVDLASAIV